MERRMDRTVGVTVYGPASLAVPVAYRDPGRRPLAPVLKPD